MEFLGKGVERNDSSMITLAAKAGKKPNAVQFYNYCPMASHIGIIP
jgi:hypothetical protein